MRNQTFFPFAPQCYGLNDDGFWVFKEELASEENFSLFTNESMPDKYVLAAKRAYQQRREVLLVSSQRYFASDQKTGFENRTETMKAL